MRNAELLSDQEVICSGVTMTLTLWILND